MILIYNLIRVLFYPFVRWFLPLVSKNARERVIFEQQNHVQKDSLRSAQYAFEISSEGELEQVFPVLQHLLDQEKTVELVYCSPSVEHRIKELQHKYPQRLRVHVMPLICYWPFSQVNNVQNWLTAPKLILCRYDFFPELIYYGASRELIVLSGSLINYDQKNFVTKLYLKYCYGKFNKIVAVSQEEKDKMVNLMSVTTDQIEVFDFRIIQINKRLESRENFLHSKWKLYPEFLKLELFKRPTLIFGSFWNQDIDLVKGIYQKQGIVLVPHKLDKDNLEELKQKLTEERILFREVNPSTSLSQLQEIKNPDEVIIVNFKGILCELYGDFETSYVGGGFNVSIHSVLEPYMAGCRVFVGPRIHRSSEFAIIKSYQNDAIYSFGSYAELTDHLKKEDNWKSESDSFTHHYLGHFNPLLEWLGVV